MSAMLLAAPARAKGVQDRAGRGNEGERRARARGALTAAPSIDPARAANTARSAVRRNRRIADLGSCLLKRKPFGGLV